MPSKALVSVIVPAYRHEAYVTECLSSIVAQTYSELELLIVNDGSPDRTHEAIEEFLAEHSGRFRRVVYVNRENRGISATLNELLGLARGRFVFQIASDDRAKPDAIETLAAFLGRHPRFALAVGDNEIIDGSGTRVYWDSDRNNVANPEEATYLTFGGFLRASRRPREFTARGFGHIEGLEIGNFIPNGKLFRRSALRRVGGWRPGTLEDWDLNFRLAEHYRFAYIDRILFSYRWHATNTIKDPAHVWAADARTRELIEAELRKPLVRLKLRLRRYPPLWLRAMHAIRRRATGRLADLGIRRSQRRNLARTRPPT